MTDRPALIREQFDGFQVLDNQTRIFTVEAAAEMTRYHVVAVETPDSDERWLVAVTNLSDPWIAQLPQLGGWHWSYLLGKCPGTNPRTAMALVIILDELASHLHLQ